MVSGQDRGDVPLRLRRLSLRALAVVALGDGEPAEDVKAADLLEVTEDRIQLRSTIVTSQLPVAHWHVELGEATVATAILDRLLYHCQVVVVSGDSYRLREAKGVRLAAR